MCSNQTHVFGGDVFEEQREEQEEASPALTLPLLNLAGPAPLLFTVC